MLPLHRLVNERGGSPGWLATGQRTASNHNLVYFHPSSLWSLSPSRIYIEKIHRDSYRHHKWVTWHLWHYSKTQTKPPLCLANLTGTEDCGQLYLAAISRSTRADVIFHPGGGIVLTLTNVKNVEKKFDANQRNKKSKMLIVAERVDQMIHIQWVFCFFAKILNKVL